jgi:hypothetical protein
MTESFRDKRDREKIRAILKESLQIKGFLPESRKAFDESWMELLRDYKSAHGIEFNKLAVRQYLEEHGCSNHIIEQFLKSVFPS